MSCFSATIRRTEVCKVLGSCHRTGFCLVCFSCFGYQGLDQNSPTAILGYFSIVLVRNWILISSNILKLFGHSFLSWPSGVLTSKQSRIRFNTRFVLTAVSPSLTGITVFNHPFNKTDSNQLSATYMWVMRHLFSLKELRHRSCFLKKLAIPFFKIVISNPFQSSPFSAILVPFCFRINPLVFSFLSKPLFLGFPALQPQFRPSKKWLQISWRSSLNSSMKQPVYLLEMPAVFENRLNLRFSAADVKTFGVISDWTRKIENCSHALRSFAEDNSCFPFSIGGLNLFHKKLTVWSLKDTTRAAWSS